MWHLRNSPSLYYKSPGEYSSTTAATNSPIITEYPSSVSPTSLFDYDPEKYPFLHSFSPLDNDDDDNNKKWKPRSPQHNSFSEQLFNSYKIRWMSSLIFSYINKKVISLIIISIALITSVKQVHTHLAYFQPTQNWYYLEKNQVDLLSDNKIVDLVRLIYENPHLHKNYYTNIYDKRITPALYLFELTDSIKDHQLDPSFKFQFSWMDWINFDERLLPSTDYLLNHNGMPISNCSEFETSIGFPSDNLFKIDTLEGYCTDLSNWEISKLVNLNYPQFKINSPIDEYDFPVEARIVYGASYVYHNLPSPERLIFTDGLSGANLIIPISNRQSLKKMVFPSRSDLDLSFLQPIDDLMSNLVNQVSGSGNGIEEKSVIKDVTRITRNKEMKESYQLSKADFENPSTLLALQEVLVNLHIKDSLDSKLYKNIINEYSQYSDGDYPKYFHEPRVDDNKIGGSHYDWRFFNIREIDNEYKRISNLNRIIRAWLRFTNNAEIDTWIAHGSLLGYSFNGFMLPWDYDHDVQVTSKSMWKMAKYYNQSLIIDCTTDDQFSSGYGQYLLDISSNFFNRTNDNGNNAIDARFIDIHTGMYIDITQLSDVENKEHVLKHDLKKMHKVLKAEFYRLLKGKKISIDQIIEDDDLIGCKNHHFYGLEELSELEKEVFEGEYSYIPSNYAKILDREFPKRKTSWKHEGYTWRSGLGMWVSNKRCGRRSFDRDGDSCSSDRYVTMMEELLISGSSGEERRSVFPDWEAVAAVEAGAAELGNMRQ